MENIMQNIIMACTRVFFNGVAVVNTTPHPITFQDGADIVIVPASQELLLNAVPAEQAVDDLLVRTSFSGSSEGMQIIDAIQGTPMPEGARRRLIVGSIIAARNFAGTSCQPAHPGPIYASGPVPAHRLYLVSPKRFDPQSLPPYQ